MNQRIEDIGCGMKIVQSSDVFSFGTDAVLLSKFASVYNNDRIIDLGAGTGLLSFMLLQRKKISSAVALELQPALVQLCQQSVLLNSLEQVISVVQGDIRQVKTLFPSESFDLALSNPPYLPVTGSLLNAKESVAVARHELCCRLEDVISAFAWLIRFGGKAAIVHRPQRLGDIICLMRDKGMEPKRMQLVHPRADREANILLLEAEKGAKPGLRVLSPLILKGDDTN